MFNQKPVWVNIDLQTKRYTLHRDCMYTNKICETPYKGVGKIKRDGGWIRFRNAEVALNRQKEDFDHFELVVHCE